MYLTIFHKNSSGWNDNVVIENDLSALKGLKFGSICQSAHLPSSIPVTSHQQFSGDQPPAAALFVLIHCLSE